MIHYIDYFLFNQRLRNWGYCPPIFLYKIVLVTFCIIFPVEGAMIGCLPVPHIAKALKMILELAQMNRILRLSPTLVISSLQNLELKYLNF